MAPFLHRIRKGKIMINTRKAELLAPAGSFDSLKAAVAAGADAIYMGRAAVLVPELMHRMQQEKKWWKPSGMPIFTAAVCT